MTVLKLSPSSLCIRTNSTYRLFGVEPVASPNTQFSFFDCLSRISLAISAAANFDPSTAPSKIFTGILSNASIKLISVISNQTLVLAAKDTGVEYLFMLASCCCISVNIFIPMNNSDFPALCNRLPIFKIPGSRLQITRLYFRHQPGHQEYLHSSLRLILCTWHWLEEMLR